MPSTMQHVENLDKVNPIKKLKNKEMEEKISCADIVIGDTNVEIIQSCQYDLLQVLSKDRGSIQEKEKE